MDINKLYPGAKIEVKSMTHDEAMKIAAKNPNARVMKYDETGLLGHVTLKALLEKTRRVFEGLLAEASSEAPDENVLRIQTLKKMPEWTSCYDKYSNMFKLVTKIDYDNDTKVLVDYMLYLQHKIENGMSKDEATRLLIDAFSEIKGLSKQ
jgi:hypothetical protein